MLAPKSRADREEHRTGPDSDMARVWERFDRSLARPRILAHHVHTQLSCCLAAVQRALGGAFRGDECNRKIWRTGKTQK